MQAVHSFYTKGNTKAEVGTPMAATSVQKRTDTYLIYMCHWYKESFLYLSYVWKTSLCLTQFWNLPSLFSFELACCCHQVSEHKYRSFLLPPGGPSANPLICLICLTSVQLPIQVPTHPPHKVCWPAEHLDFLPRQGKDYEESTAFIKIAEIGMCRIQTVCKENKCRVYCYLEDILSTVRICWNTLSRLGSLKKVLMRWRSTPSVPEIKIGWLEAGLC